MHSWGCEEEEPEGEPKVTGGQISLWDPSPTRMQQVEDEHGNWSNSYKLKNEIREDTTIKTWLSFHVAKVDVNCLSFTVIELHTAHYQNLLLYISFYSVLILLKLYPRRTKRISTTRLHPRNGTQD